MTWKILRAAVCLCFVFAVGLAQAQIWRTGQVITYYVGDDGDLREGVPWPSPRFTENPNGTVTDNLTGLVWLKDANCMGTNYPSIYPDSIGAAGTVNWQHALEFVQRVNTGELSLCAAGYNDWRLPNVRELRSLVDYSRYSPALPAGHPFLNVTSYWSSTSYANDPASALVLWISHEGQEYSINKATPYAVWTVRAGQIATVPVRVPKTGQTTCYDLLGAVIACAGTGQDGDTRAGIAWPDPRFTIGAGAEQQCITDRLSGLMWTRAPAANPAIWAQALASTSGLSLCGHSDWRVPNVNEIESLLHAGRASSATWLQEQGFTSVPEADFWSSTTQVCFLGCTGWAWGGGLAHGGVGAAPKSEALQLLAVRGHTSAGQTTATTTTLASDVNPQFFGVNVALTASVQPASGTGTPSGMVTFLEGATQLGQAALQNGNATLVVSTLAVGAHSLTASYGGDAAFAASTSLPLAETIVAAPTTTVITSSLNPSMIGQSVVFTATVTPQYSGSPSGTVQFWLNSGSLLGSAALSGGTATFTRTFAAAGSVGVYAKYLGDANFLGSTSSAVTQKVNKFPTATAVVSSLNPSLIEQSVTFTATVSSSYGSIPDGETVTFKIGTTILGTGTLSGGSASFSTSALAAGTFNVTAAYKGDARFAASSGSVKQVVSKYATTTVLVSSLNPSRVGQAVVFTATLSSTGGAIPNGEIVTFKKGAAVLGTATLSGGSASFTTSSLPAGTNTILAVYGGDSRFAGSSGSVKQVVNKYTTTTVLVSSPNPSNLGQSVTFTATVSSIGGAIPDGETVTFKYGAIVLGTAATSGGNASVSVSSLPAGSDTVTATYAGDAKFATSRGSVLQKVM